MQPQLMQYTGSVDAAGKTLTLKTQGACPMQGGKVVNMEGERGMLSEVITFTMEGKGQYVVTCRRALVIAGDYGCTAAKP